MSIRVNLLLESEMRRVGIANRQSVIRVSCVAAAAMVVAVAVLVISGRIGLHADLSRLRSLWENNEPGYEEIQKLQSRLESSRKLIAELAGWEESRIKWRQPLTELQTVVPPSIQLTKLNIVGSTYSSETSGKKAGASVMRSFKLTLDGRIAGEMGDEVVVRFLEDLRRTKAFRDLLVSVKLQKLQRDRLGAGPEAVRVFSLEGVFGERKLR